MTLLVICTCVLQNFLKRIVGKIPFLNTSISRFDRNKIISLSVAALACNVSAPDVLYAMKSCRKNISIHGNRAMALLASSPTQIHRLLCLLLRVTRAAERRCPAPRRAAGHGIWSNDFGESFITQKGQNITRYYKTPKGKLGLLSETIW